MGDIHQLNEALVRNFLLKAKILSVLFGAVLLLQLSALVFVSTQTDLIGKVIPVKMTIVGPCLLFTIFICEILAFRYMKRLQGNATQIKNSFIYLSTFVEVSFPNVVMFMAASFMAGTALFPSMQVLNSPLLVMISVMIILSSLLLDARLAFFAGAVGGIEYLLLNLFFLRTELSAGPIDYANAITKSIFLVVAGLLAGFVSRRIREAVMDSLHHKNELIHNLDARVAEKTAEVVAQKDLIERKNVLLEEKQKEILDSIHYAKRIQYTLLPHERYITKALERLSRNS
jgi:K+-sensing histidine kinase KdpD